MSMGKSGGSTYQTAQLTPEQQQQIKAQTEFFTGTVAPAYQGTIKGAQDIYKASSPGVTNAAQNLAGISQQAQNVLGTTGQSAVQTGIQGLENLFGKDYEAQQMAAVLNPAQAQYQQNLAGLTNQFGGAGQIGSARQALANTQLAGTTQQQQQQAAAQVQNQIAQQRMGAAGLGQAIGAAGQGVTAAMTPQQLYNQYASVLFGTPASSYNPSFAGTQGQSVTSNTSNFGIKI